MMTTGFDISSNKTFVLNGDLRKTAPMFCLMISPARTNGQICH